MDNYSEIIGKARELAKLIEDSDITRRYRESLEKMKGDVSAQKLLARLVRLGEEITTSGEAEEGAFTGPAEREIIGRELENNELVKSHIMIQKEYLDLINKVQYKIKNPS